MAIDTKERILDVAEHLFADSGYSATSLREITREASVNLASVHYHFGSKEALLTATLDRRFSVINQLRIDQLDQLEATAGPGGPRLDEILRAFLGPPFEMRAKWGESGRKFVRFVGRIHSETDEIREVFGKLFQPVMSRFMRAFLKALPELDPDEIEWRAHFLVGAMAHTMTWCESFESHTTDACVQDGILESLIQFGNAGMATPSVKPAAGPTYARVNR